MIEEWRPIQGNLDLYEVSNLGRVRRKDHKRLLSTKHPDKIDGYCRVVLKSEKGYTTRTVHSLVANAFIKRPDGSQIHIHHRNGDKTDNRVDNLEWVNPHEHGRIDAERRKKDGIKTKHNDNWVTRKMLNLQI